MLQKGYLASAGVCRQFWWTTGLLLTLLVAASSIEQVSGTSTDGRPVRSPFSRSLDALRVRGNQFVRGIPCEVACEFCGCEGNYIGEKCVCFCPDNNKENTECLTAIRKDELRSGIDNDILILTRTGARFARDIRQHAVLRARMGRGASVSWKSRTDSRQGYVGNVKIYGDR